MKLFAPCPQRKNERRAPLNPQTVGKLRDLGLHVMVQSGIGAGQSVADQAFTESGAVIIQADGVAQAMSECDVFLSIEPLTVEQVHQLKEGCTVVGMLEPITNLEMVQAMAERKQTALSLEFLPRISRAQAMDVLSSQASIGGYKSVLLAAEQCSKMLPMMMTAAGTLSAAKVFVIGVGVAGLQAIATAKRLGAIVEAYDVREATKDQVISLGARFVQLPKDQNEDQSTSGGYAKEQTEEDRQKQAELMAKHITGADIVITTAAVFGRKPPMLIPADVVARMTPGSVVVDLGASAAYGSGNCELTEPGQTITTDNGITLIGQLNLPSTVPTHATQALANNFLSLLSTVVADAAFTIDLHDELHGGAAVVYQGDVRNQLLQDALDKANASEAPVGV